MLVDIPSIMAGHGLEVVGPITPLQERPGRLVARVETGGGSLVIKAATDPGAFATEVAAIARLAGHGLPVSGVVAVSAGPPSYLVLSWTEGAQLTSASPLAAQRAAPLRRDQLVRLQRHQRPHDPPGGAERRAGRRLRPGGRRRADPLV